MSRNTQQGKYNPDCCWHCRHDHQSCIRDPTDPSSPCLRCQSLGYYPCTIEKPATVPGRRTLNFSKCDQCRNDRQKCEPVEGQWPERCDRCKSKGYPCSPRSNKKSTRRRGPGQDGSSSGGGGSTGFHNQDQGERDYYDEGDYEGEDDGSPRYASDGSGGYYQHGPQTEYYSEPQYANYGDHSQYGQLPAAMYGKQQYNYGY